MRTGEYIRSTTEFYGALDQRGFSRQKLHSGIRVFGLSIRPPEAEQK